MSAAYHPEEAAIVRMALKHEPTPDDASLDVWNEAGFLPKEVVCLLKSNAGSSKPNAELAANNALARLVLSGFEGTLPVFRTRGADGVLREVRPTARRRTTSIRAFPIHLFSINWADSGPGCSWPEAYHLGWLPGFDVWVVVASQDSTDMYGYCDRVLGHFELGADPIEASCNLIKQDWQSQLRGWEQEQWVEILAGGRVNAGDVSEIASKVWKQEEEADG